MVSPRPSAAFVEAALVRSILHPRRTRTSAGLGSQRSSGRRRNAMIPTPNLDHLGKDDFEHVYEPAEDTFLLLDALEADADALNELKPRVCLEIGSGSGCVSAFAGKVIGASNALFLTTDINPHATRATALTGRRNLVSIDTVRTDLVSSLLPRLQGKVDLLLFNPPYVPTFEEEEMEAQSSAGIAGAWAGGRAGVGSVVRLVEGGALEALLAPEGLFYLVAVKANDPAWLIRYISERCGLSGDVALQRRAGREHLFVLKFRKPPRAAAE